MASIISPEEVGIDYKASTGLRWVIIVSQDLVRPRMSQGEPNLEDDA
jgi:hypothetical protein